MLQMLLTMTILVLPPFSPLARATLEMSQQPLSAASLQWKAELRRTWDVLGPFPQRAREHHFLSPVFPLRERDLASPFERNDNDTWPSSLADGGTVRWSSVDQSDSGHLSVSFPDIRWANLRAFEGWSALQHHALLHTTLRLSPPTQGFTEPSQQPRRLLVRAVQATFFAIVSPSNTATPEWHAGNVYDFPSAPRQFIDLPPLADSGPIELDVYVSGDYEIRLFGDPGNQSPSIEIDFTVELEYESQTPITHAPQFDVVPDILDGHPFGSALAIGLRGGEHDCELTEIQVFDSVTVLTPPKRELGSLRAGQTRQISLEWPTGISYTEPEVPVVLTFRIANSSETQQQLFSLKLNHRHSQDVLALIQPSLKATHLVASSAVVILAVPPVNDSSRLPILFLHGAGVEGDNPLLPSMLTRQPHSWIAFPTGRTSWGYDWHGPSTRHALETLKALAGIIASHPSFSRAFGFKPDSRFVLVGHSNGGQGAWFLGSRYPDRVAAVMPGAAYMKSQQYLSWAMERSAHFIDPALSHVLRTSMTGDDNDLFASNLVGKPLLALHGGEDENVPTYHSRELVSTIRTWTTLRGGPQSNLSYIEIPNMIHWADGYFASVAEAPAFLNVVTQLPAVMPRPSLPSQWTQIVMWPHESGSLNGVQVLEVSVPGRLAKVTVSLTKKGYITIKTNNVHRLAVSGHVVRLTSLSEAPAGIEIDGATINLSPKILATEQWLLKRVEGGDWVASIPSARELQPQNAGPVGHALDTAAAVRIVIPDNAARTKSAGIRLAHTLLLYLAFDADIVTASDAIRKPAGEGTVFVISTPEEPNAFANEALAGSPLRLDGGHLTLNGRKVQGSGVGAVLARARLEVSSATTVFVLGNDAVGLERALRLVPFRTGLAVPEWLVVGQDAELLGAAGVIGAGFWGRGGGWSDRVSWVDGL